MSTDLSLWPWCVSGCALAGSHFLTPVAARSGETENNEVITHLGSYVCWPQTAESLLMCLDLLQQDLCQFHSLVV